MINQNYTLLRACPVCDRRSGTVLSKLVYALFDDLDMPGTKTLIRCNECGMMFDDVGFTEEQLREYYRRNEHYAVSSTGGSGGISDDNNGRYDRILDTLRPGKEGLILDFGCSQGGFVSQCLKRGLCAAGIEPSAKSRKVGLDAGLDISESIEAFRAAHLNVKVQAVIISHVLEHMLTPLKTLRDIVGNYPEAKVYIEVPDAASYLAPNAIRWHEMYFEHLCHFRRKNIVDIAKRARIRIIGEGFSSFSVAQQDTRCCFLVGELDDLPQVPESFAFADRADITPLPPVPGVSVPFGVKSLALWGVSQYAMLLLGSRPEISRINRLFDASPAKVGRKIHGVIVESSEKISTMSEDTILILPFSPYIREIRQSLEKINYKGRLVEI